MNNKALTYEEFSEQFMKRTYADFIEYQWAMDELKKYYELVMQPFKAEMIMDLFEIKRLSENSFEFPKNQGYVQFGSVMNRINSYIDSVWDRWEFPITKTLNHFISDCSRAGVQLKWNENIIKNNKICDITNGLIQATVKENVPNAK